MTDALFCDQCGARLPTSSAKFCPSCGEALDRPSGASPSGRADAGRRGDSVADEESVLADVSHASHERISHSGHTAESVRQPAAEAAPPASVSDGSKRTSRNVFAYLAVIVIAVFCVGFYFTPHIAVNNLKAAAEARDVTRDSLSDSNAKQIVERHFDASGVVLPARGKWRVVNDIIESWNMAEGSIGLQKYKEVLALGQIGILTVYPWQKIPAPGAGFIFPSEITVHPTPEGEKLISSKNPRVLILPMGAFKVTDIVKNEKREIGIQSYRVLMVQYDWTIDKRFKQMSDLVGNERYGTKRKGIVLLKWNDFEKKWDFEASDYANADEDFNSNNVDRTFLGKR